MSKVKSLTQQATRGAFWSLASNIFVSAISFIGTAIMARLLEPKDFGLIGMAGLVTGVVLLFGNFGLGAALVQKQEVDDEDLSTAFWANCAAGFVLMMFCILIAPLAGNFFHEKAVQWVLICLAFNFVLSSLATVHNTILFKNIQMKSIAFIEVVGRVLRVGIMLIAAFYGMSFWSIVIGMIVERFFKTVIYWLIYPWRPSLVFSVQRFKDMFRFGRNLLCSGFIGYLNRNMDFIVTGRVLGADLLGFYQMAYNLPHILRDYVSESIGAVAFPVFCKAQDDNDRLTKGFLKIVKFIALGTFPILFGLAFTAHDFIYVAYGERWLSTVVPLQILCFCAALASVNSIIGALLYAKGRPDLDMKWGFVRLPIIVIAILVGVRLGSIVGVAWGMLIVEFLSFVLVWQVFRILNNDFKEYWKALFPAIVACAGMVAALIYINSIPYIMKTAPWIRLGIEFMVGAIAYSATLYFLFNAVFRESICFVKQSLGAKS